MFVVATRGLRMRWLRILIVCAGFWVCMPNRVVAQSAPVIGPSDAIGFDYVDADYDLYLVSGFEAAYDGGAYQPVAAPKFQSVNGVSSYKFIPAPTTGQHIVSIRACNAIGCGAGSAPFAFAALASSPTTAPVNLRKVPR